MNSFSLRRKALAEKLPKKLIVLTGYEAVQLSGDNSAPFLQESNFFYLTGITEPGWGLIFDTGKKQTWLVQPVVDEVHSIFESKLSADDALSISGVDKVITITERDELLDRLAKERSIVHTLGADPHAAHYDFSLNPAPARLRRELKKRFTVVKDCRQAIVQLKAIKHEDEVENIEKAIDVTVIAFARAYAALKEARHEYDIEAEFTDTFLRAGAYKHAYEPIVAGAGNACTLHYVANNKPLPENGLVLIDIGARVNGYAADITRTYALGTPSDREVAVHAAVERAHKQIIKLLEPGLSVKTYQENVDEIMKAELEGLGLLEKPENYRKYFPHAISHGLGIDVHDSLGGPETFQPGMVLTVEPGIYIPEEGIGVRIEDDILITKTGHRNLSADLSTAL